MAMENALEKYRKDNGLTFEQMAFAAGFKSRSTVLKHCRGVKKIPAEAAFKYSHAFGIPLGDMREDLHMSTEVNCKPPIATPATQRGGEDAA